MCRRCSCWRLCRRHLSEITEEIPERGLQSEWKWTFHDVHDVRSSGALESEEIMRVACFIILCLRGECGAYCVFCRLKGITTDRENRQNSTPLMVINLPWSYWPRLTTQDHSQNPMKNFFTQSSQRSHFFYASWPLNKSCYSLFFCA